MNLLKSKRWVAIGIGILSGSAFAADITCSITPAYSIITEGQTLQLAANCDGVLGSINWSMNAIGDGVAAKSVTGDVALNNHAAQKPIYYTTPVGLASSGSGDFRFTVTGVSSGNSVVSTEAQVVVQPTSAAIARAAGSANPMAPINAECGSANGNAATAMPASMAQCSVGKAALSISGPQAFTWSCLSLNGGAEATCYAVRGFTVTANAGSNGTISPGSQGVAAGATASFTATPASGYSAAISGCGGAQSGNNFTTGPVTANCTVNASFTNAPVNGACGSASNSTVVTLAPSANLCTTGSATSVVSSGSAYTWGCNGSNGGGNTSATACQAPRGFTVTTSGSDSHGSISAGKVVTGGTTSTFTVTPVSGYGASMSGSTCGGSLSGTTYTTGVITGDCNVTANFVVQTISTTDPGSGLWMPPNTTGRVIADQSGDAGSTFSYVPGCLNGQSITTSSSSGCALNASFTGIVSGTNTSTTFSFGSGNTLGLRYMSKPGAGATVKYFAFSSGDGGNLGQEVKVWLSDSPTATFESTPTTCKTSSTRQALLASGPGYCSIIENKHYYVFMSTDAVGSNYRYQVKEGTADFD